MRSHRLLGAAAVFATTLVAACAPDQDILSPNVALTPSTADVVGAAPTYVPGEVLVKFRAGATATTRGRALTAAKASVGERILTAAMRRAGDGEGVTVLRTGLGVPDAIRVMLASGTVEYAEPNWVYSHQATSNDTYVTNGSLWGMTGTYGSQASVAWTNNKTDCSLVYVGIIDEGYMYSHVDIAANAGKNPGEIEGNGKDDDSNGLIDDVYGWDFDGNNNTVFDGTGDDHGTHVAGTIGGVGGNGIGVAGVCWKVKLLDAKFLGSRGGTTANAIKAVDYFTTLKSRATNPVNIVATNNSWGGGGFSQALKDAIDRANAANILFVAAAGNSGTNNDATASYPSNYDSPNVIAVAAIDANGALASFSQYGATTVDLGAPGVGIWSSVPTTSGIGKRATITSGYASYNGTSMATPHVTGATALYAATHAGSTAAQIKAAILGSVTPTPSLAGKTLTGGRLNVSGF